MNPLIFSLISLVLVARSANFLSLIKNNKTLLYISTIPCIYLVIYGLYLILGPVNLYEDGSQNFFNQNPKEKELAIDRFDSISNNRTANSSTSVFIFDLFVDHLFDERESNLVLSF